MDIHKSLEKAVKNLASGQLKNEAQVKSAVILPILRALGWDDANPHVLLPEYPVPRGGGKGWVDYALLGEGKPRVFVEAKRIGKIDVSAETQLFEYANNQGVPILILTDGKQWDFYLSMAEGLPSDRRFHRIELDEREIPKHEEFLRKHVGRKFVLSGDARRNAESRRESNKEKDRARGELPNVWNALIKEPGGLIQECLQEEVKELCGIELDLDDVEKFLREMSASPSNPQKIQPATERGFTPSVSKSKEAASVGRTKIAGFTYLGEQVKTGTAKATLVEIVKRFVACDEELMERYSRETQSRHRALVSRDRKALYPPKSRHLIEDHSIDLGVGWWMGTNLSTVSIRDHIRTACKVAGISGVELIER